MQPKLQPISPNELGTPSNQSSTPESARASFERLSQHAHRQVEGLALTLEQFVDAVSRIAPNGFVQGHYLKVLRESQMWAEDETAMIRRDMVESRFLRVTNYMIGTIYEAAGMQRIADLCSRGASTELIEQEANTPRRHGNSAADLTLLIEGGLFSSCPDFAKQLKLVIRARNTIQHRAYLLDCAPDSLPEDVSTKEQERLIREVAQAIADTKQTVVTFAKEFDGWLQQLELDRARPRMEPVDSIAAQTNAKVIPLQKAERPRRGQGISHTGINVRSQSAPDGRRLPQRPSTPLPEIG